jgi:hypothetical protein
MVKSLSIEHFLTGFCEGIPGILDTDMEPRVMSKSFKQFRKSQIERTVIEQSYICFHSGG